MPLVNFRTNLTSLRYGMDRPGGGDSGQPFVQFPIEDASTPSSIKRYYEVNRTSLDFPVRGGAITQLISGGSGILSSTIDRARIQAFFKSAPRGKAFIDKQLGLQLSNPKTQVPNALTFAGAGLGNVNLPVTNVYTPTNTLVQVQAMGTGTFFNRHGVFPTIYEAPQQTYAYIVGAPQNNTSTTNRLAILKALKLLKSTDFLTNSSTATGLGIDPALVEKLGISTIQNQLFNYSGGPGSVYGIGFTRIFRVTNTEATDLLAKNTVGFTVGGNPDPGGIGKPYSAIAMTYQQLAEQTTRTNPAAPTLATVQNFAEQLSGTGTQVSYRDFNIANPNPGDPQIGYGIGTGNPGGPLTDNNFLITKPGAVDLVNKLNPFYFNVAGAGGTDPWTAGGTDTKDIIKFAFECLSNDNSEGAVALIFRAFLEGQISDTNQAEYSTFKYLGRGETFRTYQGFDRTIGFTFKIFAQTRDEMKPLYTKLNHLISQVYPDYSPTYNLMRGSVVRLTIGDYIYRVPGFLENVNVTIDNTNTPWEVQMFGAEIESDVAQLPQFVTVNCSFRPIMNILPARVTMERPSVPLIGNVPTEDFLITPEYTLGTGPNVGRAYNTSLQQLQAGPAAALNNRLANLTPQPGALTQQTQKQVAANKNAEGKTGRAGSGRNRARVQNQIPAALRPPASTAPPNPNFLNPFGG